MKIFERQPDSFDIMMGNDFTKGRGTSVVNAFFTDVCVGLMGESRFIGYKVPRKDGSFTFRESIIQDRKQDELLSNKSLNIENLVKKNNTDRDTYMTIGSYFGNAKSRDIENVMFVDRFVFDVDGPGHKPIPASVRDNLLDQIEEAIGEADYVIDTGRGFQMVYLMMIVENIFQIKEAYDQVVHKVCGLIEGIIPADYHCDPLTINSYYRIPGTNNSQADRNARICRHCFQKRADFNQICERLLVDQKQRTVFFGKRRSLITKPVKEMKGLYADYLKIAASGNMIGKRNKTIYAFAFNIAGSVPDETRLLQMAMNINQCFEKPLPPSEIRTTVKSAVRQHIQNPIRYGIEKQLEYIGIKEEDVPELETVAEREAKKKAQAQKKSRMLAEKRKAVRTAAKKAKMGQVYVLSKKGMNHSEIARETGLTRPTVLKYLAEVLSWFISEEDIERVRQIRQSFTESIRELLSEGFAPSEAGYAGCKKNDSRNNRENIRDGGEVLHLLLSLLREPCLALT